VGQPSSVKNSTIVSALGFALLSSAVGCAKTTDLGKMQEETIATVKMYNGELDVLQRRYDELAATRGSSADANAMLEAAGQAIRTARTLAASAPTTVATAAKSGNADALTEEHYRIIEGLVHEIDIAKDDLAGYETFASSVAYAGTKPPVIPPSDEPPPATPDTPVSNDGAGTGSAAKMPAGTTAAGHATDIPCSAEIALQCPEGQIDACMKTPSSATHGCVAK
jgi:hypothetical protein